MFVLLAISNNHIINLSNETIVDNSVNSGNNIINLINEINGENSVNSDN